MNPPLRLSVPNIEGFLCYKPEMKGSCFDVWVWKPDAEISSVLQVCVAGMKSLRWRENVSAFFFKFSWLCWVFTAAHRFSLVSVSEGYSLVAVCRLLIAVASLVAEHRLKGEQASVAVTPGLQSTASVVVPHGLSCSASCRIFPHEGSNLYPLLRKANS